jgi:hypothetical protein
VSGPLVFGLAALALAACSAQSDANPAPVKLDDLNLTPYLGKPCSLFDADQLSDLGIPKPGVDELTDADIGTCYLTPATTTATVMFRVTVHRPKGAAPTTKIAGYPAAEAPRSNGCALGVDVAAGQQIAVSAVGTDACHLAESVATSAIGAIKRQNP